MIRLGIKCIRKDTIASNERIFFKNGMWKSFNKRKNKINIQIGQDTGARFPKCLFMLNMHMFSKTKTAQWCYFSLREKQNISMNDIIINHCPCELGLQILLRWGRLVNDEQIISNYCSYLLTFLYNTKIIDYSNELQQSIHVN